MWDVQPESFLRSLKARTLHVAVALHLMSLAFILTKTGRDALYFQGRGVYDLPTAYMGMALLALPTSVLALSLMHWLGPRRARIALPLAVSAGLAAFRPLVQPGGGPLMTAFFAFVPLAFGVLFAVSWLLAAEFFDCGPRTEVARAYAVLGAASMGGGVLGALVAKVAVSAVSPQNFILLGAAALAAAAAALALTQQRFPLLAMSPSNDHLLPELADIRSVFQSRYALLLLAVGMIAALVGLLIEFQFYLAAAISGNTGRENVSFFANFYLALTGVALLVQVYLIPRLQRVIGVHGSLLVLPLAMLGGTVGLLTNTSVLTRSLLRITEGGLKSSIHRTNWEQAFLPLERAGRTVAKLLVDGLGKHVAEGTAAAFLYIWLRFVMRGGSLEGQDVSWVSYLLLATTFLWVTLTRFLGRTLAPSAQTSEIEGTIPAEIPLPDT